MCQSQLVNKAIQIANFMIDSSDQIQQQLNKLQFISHWVSLSSLLKKCNRKKPYISLRKFPEQKFARKHEMTINHLYFQRLYLACVAIQKRLKLQLSESYYEKDGLIFGVYEFYTEDHVSKNVPGIKMKEQIECQYVDGILDFAKQKTIILFEYVENLKFNPRDEYEQWSAGINQINIKNKNIQTYEFIQQIKKWPLTQHYVFNVKLKNALLLPSFLQSQQNYEKFQAFLKYQYNLIEELNSENAEVNAIFKKMETGIAQIFSILVKPNKIIEMISNNPHSGIKGSKAKEAIKQLRKQISFKITLSQSRGKAIINEQKMQSSEQNMKKIEIKAQNGLIAPVSGNVINVTIIWEMSVETKTFKLKLQCYNNRKVEDLYYDEFHHFWNELNNSEQFKQIVGIDKYTVSLSQKPTLEVVISNYCPGCLLSLAFREIDKMLALAVSIDEVIEICERKGLEIEDPNNFQIHPYMKQHTVQKFRRAMNEINKNSSKLYRLKI